MAREKPPNVRGETLAARALQASAAVTRIDDLERKLESAHEELSRQENEIDSLRKSLALNGRENARLCESLAAASTAVADARSQAEEMRMALRSAQAEREKAGEARRMEISTLKAHLEDTLVRATTAEKQLSETYHDLLTATTDKSAAERKATKAESALDDKERRMRELEVAQGWLREERNRLQQTCATHEIALRRAEERVRSLTALFLELETRVNLRNSGKESDPVERQPQCERSGRVAATGPGIDRRSQLRVLDEDAWLFCGRPGIL